MNTTTNYSLWFVEAVASIAREAWGRMMQDARAGIFSPYYLWYQPHGLRFHVVRDDEPRPDGCELVTGQRIPSDRTVEQLTAYLHPLCGAVPVLPGDRPPAQRATRRRGGER